MRLIELHQFLGKIRAVLIQIHIGNASPDVITKKYSLEQIQDDLSSLRTLAEEAGLPMTIKWIDRLNIVTRLQRDGAANDFNSLERGGNLLATVMEDEISSRAYFAMEGDEIKHWNKRKSFGDQVSEKFPSTDYELEESSKCYAVGRHTAAVFHLMRVLEVGLTSLSKSIGADPSNKNWEQVLNGIQKKLEENSRMKPDGWKDTEQFYSEASAHFRNLKNAWRNYTMHVHATYDKERSEDIYVHVRSMMKLLSARIQET